jgi:hypothetical protein
MASDRQQSDEDAKEIIFDIEGMSDMEELKGVGSDDNRSVTNTRGAASGGLDNRSVVRGSIMHSPKH